MHTPAHEGEEGPAMPSVAWQISQACRVPHKAALPGWLPEARQSHADQ